MTDALCAYCRRVTMGPKLWIALTEVPGTENNTVVLDDIAEVQQFADAGGHLSTVFMNCSAVMMGQENRSARLSKSWSPLTK